MEDAGNTVYASLAIALFVVFIKWRLDPLRAIPTLGGTDWPLLSYIGASRFKGRAREILQEGYDKYYGSAFKIPMLDQWLVVVSGPRLIDDIRKRPDDEFAFDEAIEDFMQISNLIGGGVREVKYHVDIVKEKLTRGLPVVLPDVMDELAVAFRDHIPDAGDQWVSLNLLTLMQEVIARASNRVFVGLPVCRNREYLDIAIGVTGDLAVAGLSFTSTPVALKPYVAKMTTRASINVPRVLRHIGPVIEEREAAFALLGEGWSDKPNDMLQWLLDEARSRGVGPEGTAKRLLLLNFAAIHTSSTTISQAILHLAERPDWAASLRQEAERVLGGGTWTKAGIDKMWRLDSFLRETQRYNGLGLASVLRQAMKDVTLCDGTRIPKGTLVVAASFATHHDEANYPDAGTFDPFRFSRLRESGPEESLKHQFVHTSVEYMSFGHGRHACPGRFFVANELKAMLAYLVVNYDIELEEGTVRSEPHFVGLTAAPPSPDARVRLRKRAVRV